MKDAIEILRSNSYSMIWPKNHIEHLEDIIVTASLTFLISFILFLIFLLEVML